MGLFCKRALKKRQYSTKETYNFKEPTNRSHPILYETSIYTCALQVRVVIHTLIYTGINIMVYMLCIH